MPQRAVPIDVPGLAWSAGSPEPVVVASERRCLVAFYRREAEGWTLEDPPADEVAVAELDGCVVVRTGFPNDEALGGHPLAGAGLEPYRAHVVEDSEWVEELRRVESHHPAPYRIEARHYLLAFHDSTLEAVARDLRVVGTFATMRDAVAHMASLVG
ncbi:MAG TPA: hypothetical protein VF519_00315 [Mycobacteriales bacterium]|jgi:hypothetical protein